MAVSRSVNWAFQSASDAWRIGSPSSARQRIVLTAVVTAVSFVCAAWLIGRPGYASDFAHYWHGARVLIDGGNPYRSPLPSDVNPGLDPALYPLPAYLLLAPFALLPLGVAGGLFMAISAGLAALGVARTGLARAPVFLSAPFLLALSLGQWSPLLLGATLLPWASWVMVAKPNLGIATWLARPDWRTAAAIAVVLVVSLALSPEWPREWIDNVSHREEKFIPLFRPGGLVLLAAALAWRRAEGRLLLVLAAVPQGLFFSDQLLLWLVPRTLRQSLLLSIFSVMSFLAWQAGLETGDYYVREAVPFASALYFAALAILLSNWWSDRQASSRRAPAA